MLEQVKQILLNKYDSEIERYDVLKTQVIELEDMIAADNSEEVYKENLKMLKKAKLKKHSDEYNEKLKDIEMTYEQALIDFKKTYDKYIELKTEMSKIDIYGFQRKKLRVENAKELKDLKIDEAKAYKIVTGELSDIM